MNILSTRLNAITLTPRKLRRLYLECIHKSFLWIIFLLWCMLHKERKHDTIMQTPLVQYIPTKEIPCETRMFPKPIHRLKCSQTPKKVSSIPWSKWSSWWSMSRPTSSCTEWNPKGLRSNARLRSCFGILAMTRPIYTDNICWSNRWVCPSRADKEQEEYITFFLILA